MVILASSETDHLLLGGDTMGLERSTVKTIRTVWLSRFVWWSAGYVGPLPLLRRTRCSLVHLLY